MKILIKKAIAMATASFAVFSGASTLQTTDTVNKGAGTDSNATMPMEMMNMMGMKGMDNMMSWSMGLTGLLAIVILVLTAAALIKYLIGRRD